MTTVDVTTSFAQTLVDEWVRAGVTHAVVCPGSRNTPLVLALARDARIVTDVVLDERSAAFRALGVGLASGRPAIVCCTSGTAAANLHPAVVEAHHARVPLLVCTADRPPELRDCGAAQTIDQAHMYGHAVRWFHDPGPPDGGANAPARWRALASRSVAAAIGRPAGPVHLNLPFREPLIPTGAPLLDAPGRSGGAPWVNVSQAAERQAADADIARIAELVQTHARGVLVAGSGAGVDVETATRFAAAAGWPVLADPLSQCRAGTHAVSTYEALLRVDAFAAAHRPDVVVRVGAPLTSKIANAWLSEVPHVVVDPDAVWLDPERAASEYVVADPGATLTAVSQLINRTTHSSDWLAQWCDGESKVRSAIDAVLDEPANDCEARVARDLAAAVPVGSTLVVASSLPVRALEWSMVPRTGMRVLANRGANGIDGFVSTVGGVAAGSDGAPTIGLCGDLCFLHDTNGLAALGAAGAAPVTIVVVDNDGGGIFEYLPQRTLPEFEPLFGTPQGLDVVSVARAHGVGAERVDPDVDWHTVLHDDGVQVAVVTLSRAGGVAAHHRMWDAAVTAVGG